MGSAWTVTRKRLTGTKTCNVSGQRVRNYAEQQKIGQRVDGNTNTVTRDETCNVNGQRVWNCAKQQKTGQRVDGNAKTVNGDENV